MDYLSNYFEEAAQIARQLDRGIMNQMVERLVKLRADGGRLFLLGVGGSAGNCGHAVNDFRKLAKIEAYAPTDNVSELTARTNDEGWDTVFSEWLKISKASENDVVLIFSVGGGSKEKNISPNLVAAIDLAKERGVDVMGIVGRDGGHTKRRGDIVLVVPPINPSNVTPHTEAFQAVVWHALVSDPRLMAQGNKWESTARPQAAAPVN